jgi:polyphosphate kinase
MSQIAPAELETAPRPVAADEPRYFNRELSWLEFNGRVLEEALDARHPLLERVKFLAIFSTNLDEFFMIRVAGLKQQVAAGVAARSPDGMTPAEQLAAIRRGVIAQTDTHRDCWLHDVAPQLRAAGIFVLDYAELTAGQRAWCREYFEREIYPVLTPLAFDPSHPFPLISNLSINLAVVINDPEEGELFARVKVPATLPRLIELGDCDGPDHIPPERRHCFVWLEEMIAANVAALFPGMDVVETYTFRVTRNADVEIEEEEAADLLATIEAGLRQRRFGAVVRLTIQHDMPQRIRELLMHNLKIGPEDVYEVQGPLGLSGLMELTRVDRPDLKDPPFYPRVPALLRAPRGSADLFAAIRQQDILLHHPFDSFQPVVDFIEQAADDPHVLAIKQTLYRVGPNSPIVHALMRAREEDKQVTVLVELKARFDEENNITWARALERAGVHVVYGLLGLKTHAKLALVVRREADGLRRYVHLGTGNYNATTARVYTDLGLLSCRPALGADASDLFNFLTGYSRQQRYRALLVAPVNLRARLLQLIEREVGHARAGRAARLVVKCNALVDPGMIEALYAAGQAGVRVELLVRGMCSLRPGVAGLSEGITVRSIVGRFLEHSRVLYFHNGGQPEVYLGSADLMERNLDRRVEVLFPVLDAAQVAQIEGLLAVYLRDNVRARELLPDGSYRRVQPAPGEPPIDSQALFAEGCDTPQE